MPSTTELTAMYAKASAIGLDTSGSYRYWSSTESSTTLAYTLNPSTGAITSDTKGATTVAMRPIRAFDTNILSGTKTVPNNAGTYTVTPSALTLSAGRPISNYVAIQYVSAATPLKIAKVAQSALKISSSLTGVVNQPMYLTANGGNSTKATIFKLAGGSASNCSLGSTSFGPTVSLTASGTGSCLVYAVKPADNNYLAVVSPMATIVFETFTAFVQFIPSVSTGIGIVQGPTRVDTTSIAAPVDTFSINSLSPSSPIGTTITLTGTGFTTSGYTISYVRVGMFGTKVTTGLTITSSTIAFTIPAGSTTGPIRVGFTNGTNYLSSVEFVLAPTVVSGAPTITSFTPTSGVPGTTVTITGTNFTPATTVAFDGISAGAVTFTSSTQISVATSPINNSGVISVTNETGTVNSATPYTAAIEAPRFTLTNNTFTIDSQTAISTVNTYSITNVAGTPTSYALSGTLPSGITFNTSTGLLSGTPTEAKSAITFTIQAMNGAGSYTQTFTLTTLY